jgi:hypothetical protein
MMLRRRRKQEVSHAIDGVIHDETRDGDSLEWSEPQN